MVECSAETAQETANVIRQTSVLEHGTQAAFEIKETKDKENKKGGNIKIRNEIIFEINKKNSWRWNKEWKNILRKKSERQKRGGGIKA